LLITATESDVRDRQVVIARRAAGRQIAEVLSGSTGWAPSEGHTVETLFDEIDGMLRSPGRQIGRVTITYEVGARYDPRKGYPTQIDYAPRGNVADGDVSIRVRLIESPTVPLSQPSVGEVYSPPKRARIVRPGGAYDALFVVSSGDIAVRRVWPTRADEIVARGTSVYWGSVGWKPQPGMTGNVIGTFRHPSGPLIYLLEFQHRNSTLFYPTATTGVELLD
jgi:hypothetical protein